MHVTDCDCEQSGWCERHQCQKSDYWRKVCRRSPPMFQAWEDGRGPGQEKAGQPSAAIRSEPCQHLGELLRQQECPSCRGLVHLKVFQCAVHGECTPNKVIEPMACCARCDDYESTTPESTTPESTTPNDELSTL